jgi:hypothetical protein
MSLSLLITHPARAADAYSGTVLYRLTAPAGLEQPFARAAAGGQAVGVASDAQGVYHGVLWSGPAGTAVKLTPTNMIGFTTSSAFATDGTQHVGSAAGNPYSHAMLWTGGAGSAVDLHPSQLTGYETTIAYGVGGGRQVGYGSGTFVERAIVWSGTAASAVVLNPSWSVRSVAYGTDATHQVGVANGSGTGFHDHATLWSGTAASAVDLRPVGLAGYNLSEDFSEAFGVGREQQVGIAHFSQGDQHAVLWSGTAASAIDLDPTGTLGSSLAWATNGTHQVGSCGNFGAMLWAGSAASAVKLQPLLPTGVWTESTAYSIDDAGNVFGVASGTFNGVSGTYAVRWSPVPEPSAASLLAIAGVGMLRLRSPSRRTAVHG